MFIEMVIFVAALILLYFGAEWLVRGSANTAVILGANPIIVGLTVVAFGTSSPELVACLVAAFRGSPDIAIGNVIGSNIANLGLVMAIGAIVYPLAMQDRILRRDLPLMILFTIVTMVLCINGDVSRIDGGILLGLVIAYTLYYVVSALRSRSDAAGVEEEMSELLDDGKTLGRELLITAAGIVGVVIGAYFLVDSASSIARAFGISEMVIGVSIVAIGTSLPELATVAVASMKKHADIAVGAIIGSNVYNLGLILGTTALVSPLPVAQTTVTGEMGAMLFFALMILPSAYLRKMGKIAGSLLLLCYAIFIWVFILSTPV